MDTKVGQLFYSIVSKFDGSFQTNIKNAETNVKKLGKEMENSEKSTDKMTGGIANLGKKLLAGFGIAFAIKLIKDFASSSIKAFTEAQQSLIQYNNAEQNVGGTTKEQIDLLNEYILTLEKKTSVDDKTIRQAAQIYAQDQLAIELQQKLLKGTVDLAVANAKATGLDNVDVAGTAKALGLAISTGDLGRLTKQNIAGITESDKALFKMGDDAQRTAILMKILEENAGGAGEALGNSFQGDVNRAKDAIDDLQVSVGEGLSVGLQVLKGELLKTLGATGTTSEKTAKMGQAFVVVAGVLGLVVNIIKAFLIQIYGVGVALVGVVKIAFGWGKDIIGIFKQVGKAIGSIGEAMRNVLTGNFKEAKEALKQGFDFSGAFDNSKKALDQMATAVEKNQKAFHETTKDIVENVKVIANSKEVYSETSEAINQLAKAKDASSKATKREVELTQEQQKAIDDAQKKLEDFTKTLIDATEASKKAGDSLKNDLTKSFNEFSESVEKGQEDTIKNLADIVIKAEQTIKDFNGKSDLTDSDKKQLAEAQAIISARVGYEQRAAEQIIALKKRVSDAGLDPSLLKIEDQVTLEDALATARTNATLDDFTLFEQQSNLKMIAITNQFITEALLIKNKIENQKNLETDLTDFLKSENAVRTEDIEAFASTTIAKYGEIAESLKSVISLQNRLGNVTGGVTASDGNAPAVPQFKAGGYVGSQGGQVHAGEFVVPANLVSSNPDLIAMLDKARVQNNNITINTAEVGGSMSNATDDMLWRLGRL